MDRATKAIVRQLSDGLNHFTSGDWAKALVEVDAAAAAIRLLKEGREVLSNGASVVPIGFETPYGYVEKRSPAVLRLWTTFAYLLSRTRSSCMLNASRRPGDGQRRRAPGPCGPRGGGVPSVPYSHTGRALRLLVACIPCGKGLPMLHSSVPFPPGHRNGSTSAAAPS
jgi:hypothetical protein